MDLWHVESFVITYQTSIGSSNKIKNLLKDKLTEMKDSYAVDICLNYKELLGFTDEELEDIVEAYITGLEPQNVQYFINQDQVKTSIGSSNKIKNLLKEKLSKESDEDSVNVCLKYKALLGITDDELQSLILKTKYLPLNLNYNYLKKIQEGSKDYINILFTECTKNDLEFVIKLHYGYKLQYNESTQDKLSDSTKVLLGLIKKRLSSCGTEELKHFMYNLSIILNKNVLICNLKPELREAIIKNPIWKDALSLEKGIYWILNNIYTKDELIEYIKTVSVSKNNSDLNQYIYKIYNPGAHYRDIPLEISDLLVDFNLECAEGSAALYNHNPSDLPIKKIILSSLNYFSAAKNIKNVINNMTTADENKKPYILLCDALVASKTIGILSICIGIVYFGIKLLSNDTVENAKMDLKDNGFIVIDEVVKIDLISD